MNLKILFLTLTLAQWNASANELENPVEESTPFETKAVGGLYVDGNDIGIWGGAKFKKKEEDVAHEGEIHAQTSLNSESDLLIQGKYSLLNIDPATGRGFEFMGIGHVGEGRDDLRAAAFYIIYSEEGKKAGEANCFASSRAGIGANTAILNASKGGEGQIGSAIRGKGEIECGAHNMAFDLIFLHDKGVFGDNLAASATAEYTNEGLLKVFGKPLDVGVAYRIYENTGEGCEMGKCRTQGTYLTGTMGF